MYSLFVLITHQKRQVTINWDWENTSHLNVQHLAVNYIKTSTWLKVLKKLRLSMLNYLECRQTNPALPVNRFKKSSLRYYEPISRDLFLLISSLKNSLVVFAESFPNLKHLLLGRGKMLYQ